MVKAIVMDKDSNKHFRKCVLLLLKHTICVLCVWVWSMRIQFSRELNVPIVRKFTMMNLRSHLTLFSKDVGQVSTPQCSGPDIAEAQQSLKLWGLQIKPAEEFEKGMASSNLLDQDVLFLESSGAIQPG